MHRFIPLCIISSGGWLVPIGAVFGLEEDFNSLLLLHAAISQHCRNHDVVCPAFDNNEASRSVPVQPDLEKRAWAAVNLKDHLYPPEYESFIVSIIRDNCPDDEALLLIHVVNPPPTLHTDGAPAFAKLCQKMSWIRTSCAKHLESNVVACDGELKADVTKLLYERNMSPENAEALRLATIQKANTKAMAAKTRDRVIQMFSPECMKSSIQAYRNHIYSAGYMADTLLETMFRHIKQEQK